MISFEVENLRVIMVNDYHITIMKYLVAKHTSIVLTLKPKHGYCHLRTSCTCQCHVLVAFWLLILPELYLYKGSEPS